MSLYGLLCSVVECPVACSLLVCDYFSLILIITRMPSPISLLKFVVFLDLLAVGMIVPLIANHVRDLGGNHIHVGLLGSIYSGFQLASGPLIGSFSDITGRRKVLIVTLLLSSVLYIATGLTTSVIVILCLRAFLGLFKQTQLLTRALVPDYEKEDKKQSVIYGKMAAVSSAGMTLGPVVGGHLAEDHPEAGFMIVAIIVGAIFVLNAGLVHFLPDVTRRSHCKPRHDQNKSIQEIVHSLASSFKLSALELCNVEWSRYWEVFVLKALVAFSMGVYYSNYSIYLKTEYDLSPKYIGYIISFQGIIGCIASYFMGYINKFYNRDKDFSLRNFHVFVTLSISQLGLLLSFNLYIFVCWLIPLAIASAVSRLVTLETILKRSHGEHRGMLIGASNSVRSLAGVVAPMTAGLVGQYFGVAQVIYVSLLSTLFGCIMSYRVRIRPVCTKAD